MNTTRSWVYRFLALVVVVASGFWVLADSSPAHAADEPVKVTVKVTDAGFDPAVVEVNQGSVVEMTFVWANSAAHPDEQHIIVIPDYKLEADKIDSKHLQATIKFIADHTGTFTFKCDLECDTHTGVQHGQLIVKPSAAGGGAAATLLPSKLVVDPATSVVVNGGTVSLSANLQDKDGNPIPKAEVRFYAEETFLGHTQLIDIGAGKTEASGYASLLYHPRTDAARKIVAKFAGVGLYDATEQTIQLAGSPEFGPQAAPNRDDSLHGLKGGAHLGLVLVIAGVWLMFGFIAFQAWGISRVGSAGSKAGKSH